VFWQGHGSYQPEIAESLFLEVDKILIPQIVQNNY
jgi:hypothetical protein